MILLHKTNEPVCLTELKTIPDATYDDLRGDCKEEVRQKLSSDQNHLCAYCQRNFDSAVFIEHYQPQSTGQGDLDFENFLGVCSGNYYIERKSGKKIKYCSSERGNNILTVNPLDKIHIDTIYYNDNNEICSSDATFNSELTTTLNLNFYDLCYDREFQYSKEEKSYIQVAMQMGYSPLIAYEKAIQAVKTINPPFSGFIIYKFEKALEYYKRKH